MVEAGFEGWARGGLKPAHEPICVARKAPIGNIEKNVLHWGTGALHVDACRVHGPDALGGHYVTKRLVAGASVDQTGRWKSALEYEGDMQPGRWPANVFHDDSDAALGIFPGAPGQKADVNGDEPSSATGTVYSSRTAPGVRLVPHPGNSLIK